MPRAPRVIPRPRCARPCHPSDIVQSSLRGLQRADGVQHFLVLWKPAGFLLAVDQLAVDLDIEDAAAALDQLAFDAELALDRIRQTGGLGLVVSFHAVLNRNVHFVSSSFRGRVVRALPRSAARPIQPTNIP